MCSNLRFHNYSKYRITIAFTSLSFLLFITSCSENREANININDFHKVTENPVLSPDSSFIFIDPITRQRVKWQQADVFNPAAIVRDGKIFMLYRSEDNPAEGIGRRTSRLGLAESEDGIHFKKFPEPVLYPDSSEYMQYDYPGGCEDPRLVQTEEGLYVIAYTAWNNITARLSIAFSNDLIHWQKKGPAFVKAYNGKFLNSWSKSGSMITKMIKGKQVLARINGKYWMYWGEHLINLAWSDNLYEWNPLLNEKGELLSLAAPRPGMFDSDLTECGPPAIIINDGIVLLYNGKNSNNDNAAPELPRGTYSTGRIVFDKNDPKKVIERSDTSFLRPSLPHELTGQYQAGTTFAEALVFFKGRWFLYYGTADSFVGLAIAE
ncbi:MAG: glycoside hydrolase family 130 protein [Ginsengibacter sp.]